MSQLFEELRRRHVLRAGAAYLVSAWLVAQVADLLTETYAAPGWVMRALVGLLALGFPAALLLAWAYEFTPAGIQRDAEVPAESPTRARTSRRLDRAIIALLTVALLYFAVDKIWLRAPVPDQQDEMAVTPTLAVLPFENIGSDPANELLSDGIPETLLTMLTHVPTLRVIGRTSSFSFKGQAIDLLAIARQLGASVVLSGSVQRSGERLRVSASLTRSTDGAQLWAEKFDRSVDDVFAIQDAVAQRVVEASRITLSGGSGPGSVGTRNFAAYELFLRGDHLVQRRETASVAEGIRLLEQAATLDPNYADPWRDLAYAHLIDPAGRDLAAALRSARKAVEIAPDEAGSYAVLAMVLRITGDPGVDEALDRALALAPNDPNVLIIHAIHLRLNDGRFADAADVMRRVIALDPLNDNVRRHAGMTFDGIGDVAGALAQLHEAIRLEPDSAFTYRLVASVLAGVLGRRDESLRFYRKANALDPAEDYARQELVRGYAAIGADDLARHELADLRSRLSAADHLWLRAELEPLWGERAAAQELLSRVFTREDFESSALVFSFDQTGIARVPEEATKFIDNVDRVLPNWYEEALAQEGAAPVCLLELSADHERATALLNGLEPDWRKQVPYAAFTDRAAREDRLARALACTGRGDAAIMELEALIEGGYHAGGWRRLATHPAYESIRGRPEFEAILARLHAIADEERTRFLARPDLLPSDLDSLGDPTRP